MVEVIHKHFFLSVSTEKWAYIDVPVNRVKHFLEKT